MSGYDSGAKRRPFQRLIGVLAVLSLVALVFVIVTRPMCGYDLRATPGRCPSA